MITIQHTLVTLFGLRGDEEKLDGEISHVLLPDAIRRYCGLRQYSHFEEHPTRSGDISWMRYPLDVKHVGKADMDAMEEGKDKHLAEGIPPCALGERTDIPTFEKYNYHLPPRYFASVKKHLAQDIVFDDFIRDQIDCSRKYDDKYVFKGQEFDGKGIRAKIAEIENQGFYVLAYVLHEAYGITANQEWFDKHVKANLDREYSEDLAEGTYKYMRIPEEINRRITEGDWTHLDDGEISCKEYMQMYQEAIGKMPEIDLERKAKEAEFAAQECLKRKPNLDDSNPGDDVR